ncbi:hypothetical protein H5410_052838, partial [Solanum commersonii]
PQPPTSVRTNESSNSAGELSLAHPVTFLPSLSSSDLLSLLPPVFSLRREWQDKSPPPSSLSNQRKLDVLSLPQLLRPASSKRSASSAGEKSNNISRQQQHTSSNNNNEPARSSHLYSSHLGQNLSSKMDLNRSILATEEAQHLKKLIQDYIVSFIKVGDKVGASKFLKFKY